MAKGDLSQRVEAGQGDELSTLGRAFNQMAASLQRAEGNRRAMTADVAHELRTPIAVQRAHLEALQDGVYPSPRRTCSRCWIRLSCLLFWLTICACWLWRMQVN